MDRLAEELRRALATRADALSVRVEDYRGRLGNTELPIAEILEIFMEFPSSLKHVVEYEWQHSSNPHSRVQILRLLLAHVTEITRFVDNWLTPNDNSELPLYLLGAIRRKCLDMGIGERMPVIVPGPADNYTTLVGDLRNILFEKLGDSCPPLPEHLTESQYVLIRVPQMEGSNVLWAPILLGHELGHLAVNVNDALSRLDLHTHFDHTKASQVTKLEDRASSLDEAVMALYGRAESWAVELLCDAYAVRSYGIGAVASLSEYLEVIGAIDNINNSHPPGRLRIELMLSWLPQQEQDFERVLQPWRELDALEPDTPYPDWAAYLCDLFRSCAETIKDEAYRWDGSSYDPTIRSEIVRQVADDLTRGVPNDISYTHNGLTLRIEDADVISSAWLARTAGCDTPFMQLAQKGLEAQEFIRCWRATGAEWLDVPESSPIEPLAAEDAILSSIQIQNRLRISGSKQLIIRPYMHGSTDGVSVDLRLGNQFIVFVRSRTSSFDPLRTDHHPRSMQRFVQLPWGETLVLHPHELVLAATLEYLVIPTDLTAQVVTRSSYGRLGLISATAVQVHPNFHGSLTLELVNLGTVPLELTPGERIAQLIFAKTAETTTPDAKYHCTVGPQFSRVHADSEADILRRLARPDD